MQGEIQEPTFDFNTQELDNNYLAARHARDKNLKVIFYNKAIRNNFESNKAGRPIFVERPFIKIIVPGDRLTTVDAPVTQFHKNRFPELWAKFEAGMEQPETGTPLKEMPWVSTAMAEELAAFSIRTVEQLAGLNDNLTAKIMGVGLLKQKAKAFLDAALADQQNSQLQAELAQRDNQINLMKKQMAEMSESLQQLKTARK